MPRSVLTRSPNTRWPGGQKDIVNFWSVFRVWRLEVPGRLMSYYHMYSAMIAPLMSCYGRASWAVALRGARTSLRQTPKIRLPWRAGHFGLVSGFWRQYLHQLDNFRRPWQNEGT